MKLGFVGLGRMGSGIARSLLRAGHTVIVYNRTAGKTDSLAKEGAHVATSPAEAAQDADAAMTMLSDDAAVEEMVLGAEGIASTLKKGSVHISHSTISVSLARRLTTAHQEKGQGYLSAPVFGRPEAAEGKKLIVVAAGASEIIERFRPVLDAIGRRTFVAGTEPFEANVVKLCGNFMIASMMEAFGEAFATTQQSGVQPPVFLEIMNELFGSPVYQNYGKAIADQRYEPAGFALKLGLKDIRLVLQAADEQSVPMPLASLLHDHFLSAVANGQADLDWSSIAKIAARAAGIS